MLTHQQQFYSQNGPVYSIDLAIIFMCLLQHCNLFSDRSMGRVHLHLNTKHKLIRRNWVKRVVLL